MSIKIWFDIIDSDSGCGGTFVSNQTDSFCHLLSMVKMIVEKMEQSE